MSRVVRIHDGERYVSAIAREGRTKLHLTSIEDAGVRHWTVPLPRDREGREMLTKALERKGKPYPVERAIKTLRRVGRERGITEAAKRELELAGGST